MRLLLVSAEVSLVKVCAALDVVYRSTEASLVHFCFLYIAAEITAADAVYAYAIVLVDDHDGGDITATNGFVYIDEAKVEAADIVETGLLGNM